MFSSSFISMFMMVVYPTVLMHVVRNLIATTTDVKMSGPYILQDFLTLREEYTKRPAKEEKINDPSNPKHYWRFSKFPSMQ